MARNYHIFDMVIIGAGTAGIAALQEALKHTKNVVLVEKGEGGTLCARAGCMPSKALIHSARLYHSRLKFQAAGIRGAEGLNADIPAILARVRKKRDHFVNAVKSGLEDIAHYITDGEARFDAPDCIRVGSRLYHTRSTVIATGSAPVMPEAFSAIPQDRLITSDTLFERKDLPPRIGCIGLGPLGLEMAQAFAYLGIQVVAVHGNSAPGGLGSPALHQEIAKMLATQMKLYLDTTATATMDGDEVILDAAGKKHRVDALFISAGRSPALETLGLRRLKIPLRDSGVPWYDPMTLQIPDYPIFLAGDATDERAILHEAALEGKIAVQNAAPLFEAHRKADKPKVLSRYVPLNITFTDPNIAAVGASWHALQGRDIAVGEASFGNQGRAVIEQSETGHIHVFLDRRDAALLGAELFAPRGEHIAHFLALAIQQQLTAKDILAMPFYHPTFEEALRTALHKGLGKTAVKRSGKASSDRKNGGG